MKRKRATDAATQSGEINNESSTKSRAEKGYRIVSVSLYADQARFVEEVTETLVGAGFAKANRSFVIQTAIECLRKDLGNKTPLETVGNVLEHQGRRPLALAGRRIERAGPQPYRRAAAVGDKK